MNNESNPTTAAYAAELRVEHTLEIVAAYVSNNVLPAKDLPGLITSVHCALAGLGATLTVPPVEPKVDTPSAAQIKKSITPDALISFIDGKPYRTLKRHLGANGLDAYNYRARYGLPSDYPMTAPSYSERRSALAKNIGLGRPGGRAQKQVAE